MAAPAEAREFTLDGALGDWTEADRLDLEPGKGVAGFALYGYHDAANAKYVLAIAAPAAIGPGTTIWLNTDRDASTGYLVWGSVVGAEANINFAGDGLPHLYTGADGQLWQAGPISHAFSADQTVIELSFSHGLVGAEQPIDIWLDINNLVFLPPWYGGGGYHVDAVGVPAPPVTPNGAIALDGALTDWRIEDRIDRLPGTDVLNYEVYGRQDGQTVYLALRALPPAAAIGAKTTFWLNTDRNRATGHQVWGIAVGAEHNVNIAADGSPHLYTGAAAEQWQIGPLPHAYSADGTTLELAIDAKLLGSNVAGIDVSVDVNDLVFLPADFTGPGYTVWHPVELPARTPGAPLRVGIVFSATTAAQFYGDKAYNQLFAAMQHQAQVAGLPYALLHEDDVLQIDKVKDFSVLLFPYMANIAPAKAQAIEDVLVRLVYHYHTGLVTVGNFLTNDATGAALPGDSYARMKHLLGLTLDGYFGPQDFALTAGEGHRMLRGYAPGEQLQSYRQGYLLYYKRFGSVAQALARADTGLLQAPALWAATTGARSVHFASPSVVGDTELASRALRWAVFGDGLGNGVDAVGLQVSRHSSVFIGRCDMDQSQYVDEAPIVYGAMMPVVDKWKKLYNFVSSYYVNIGNKPKEGEYTNWTYSLPIYEQLIAWGNEVGTHSYTHPHYTSQLTEAQLTFEFKNSRDILTSKLSVPVTGAAVPGNPESLAVDSLLDKYFAYATADFSGLGAGFHGAMGYLSPDFQMVYLAPNMYFDFTLLGFLKYPPDVSLALWKQQFDDLTRHARTAFVVWPWHDYGPTGYEGPEYQEFMFTDLLGYVAAAGSEFVTAREAAARVKAFHGAQIKVGVTSDGGTQVDVGGAAAKGAFALELELPAGEIITGVDGWPAFSDDQVLVGSGDRGYVVRTGQGPSEGMRVAKLPMRAVLHSAEHMAGGIRFVFTGAGKVEVRFPSSIGVVESRCGDGSAPIRGGLEIEFRSEGTHTCEITYVRSRPR